MKSQSKISELTIGGKFPVQAKDFGDFVILKGPSNLAGFGRSIFEAELEFVDEVIATETEICLAVNDQYDAQRLQELESLKFNGAQSDSSTHEFGIWFSNEFDDWELICDHTGLSKEDYISRLLGCELTIAMTGFLPGFVYLNDLPTELHVPRKTNPATWTLPSTLAIGGKYAGIYSLPSAAGWNCVGRIAERIFDRDKLPPLSVSQGDKVKLKQIDEAAFMNSDFTSIAEKNVTCSIGGSGSLTFLKPGMLTTVQDRGRKGLAYFAIPGGGAMDFEAAELANVILGNTQNTAVIECHYVAPSIRFDTAATICLTGANMKWQIDGTKVKRNQTIEVSAESLLTGSAATKGCRAYIGIAGEIQTSTSFGSASCYMPANFGGNGGLPFYSGDKLHWNLPAQDPVPLQLNLKSVGQDGPLDFLPGPEFDWLDDESKKVLFTEPFQITPLSDRMGTRLAGPNLSTKGKVLADSVPLLPGMIQLTPSGQCIVVLQDGQTTGGYPRIGYLNSRIVRQLNQTRNGHPFLFRMAE